MELDQLKNIWPRDNAAPPKQDDYLLSLLNKRSNSPIAIMKRNLLMELIGVVILYSFAIVYYFLAFNGQMSEIAWFMLAVALVFVVYYYKKNKLLNNMQCVSCHVKSNLELQLGTLEKFVRFYLVAGNILMPAAMLTVGYIGIILYPHRLQPLKNISYSTSFIITYLTITAVLTVAAFFVNKWYVNRLYGRHIKKLKEILHELKED